MHRRRNWVTVVLSMLAIPALAVVPDDRTTSLLPVILITPEWHVVDLQKTPSTVNVLTERELGVSSINGLEGLQYKIPGMGFASTAGVGAAYLRGVGGALSPAGDSGVAVFVDGVYQSHVVQSFRDFYDAERVEVIKGPHAVQLGRNVIGGAISVISQDPLPYRDASADVSYGNNNQRQLHGVVNLPIGEAGLSFRLAGTVKERDGYSRNIFLDEDLDDQDVYAWRGKLRYQPSNVLDVVFSASQSRQHDSNGLANQPDPYVGLNGGILYGGTVPSDPRQVTHNVYDQQKTNNGQYSLRTNLRVGENDFSSTTAYQKTDLNVLQDLDGTEIDYSSSLSDLNTYAISQEFRLSSPQDQQFTWIAGVFLMHEDSTQQADVHFPLAAIDLSSLSTTVNSDYAIFGESTYEFLPAWRGRVGLRYNYDQSEIDLDQTVSDPFGALGPAGTINASLDTKDHWDALLPEFGISYSPNSNRYYYTKASRGFKAGGFNAYTIQPSYAAEDLWAYEAGVKLTLPSKQLRVNAALFVYDYGDIQLFTLPPGAPIGTLPVITNAAKASAQGMDFQLWHQWTKLFQFTAGVTLLDAQFDEFNSIDPNNPANNPNRSGKPLPMSSDVTINIGGEYIKHVTSDGDLNLSVDYRYQSQVYFNAFTDPVVRQAGYGLFNASVGYASRKGKWYVNMYAKNLADKLYAQNIIRVDPVLGTQRHWGEPRTIWLRIGCRL